MNSRASGRRRLNCAPMVGLFISRQSNQVTRRQAPSLLTSNYDVLGQLLLFLSNREPLFSHTLRFLIDRGFALVACSSPF
jgi:hypothetical protein